MEKPNAKTNKTADETKEKPVIGKTEEPKTGSTAEPTKEKTEELKTENTVEATTGKTEESDRKFRIPKRLRAWIRESQFLATTLSIILTFGTTAMLEHCQRIKDRKMSAMMVMSNIENIAREVEKRAQDMSRRDTIATWMLSLPLESLEEVPPTEVMGLINEVVALDMITHDMSAEKIFSNNIETWKNMGNFQFIDNVGKCFSEMNGDEKYWNNWLEEVESTVIEAIENPGDQEGKHTFTILLSNNAFREKLESYHKRQEWLELVAKTIRYYNRQNSILIGISEEEVVAFTDERSKDLDIDEKEPTQMDVRKEQLNSDSLSSMRDVDQRIRSFFKGEKGN